MSKVMIVTWSGGGNQPPAVGLAQRLRERGHEVVFAGYAGQVERLAALGFRLVSLPGANRGWERFTPATMMVGLTDRVWACPDHPADVAAVLAREAPDLVVVDCLMTAALAATSSTSGMVTAAELTTTDSLVHLKIMQAQLQIALANRTGSGPVFDDTAALAARLTADEGVWLAFLDRLAAEPELLRAVERFDTSVLPQLDALAGG